MHQYLLGSLRVCLVEEKLEGWKKGIKLPLLGGVEMKKDEEAAKWRFFTQAHQKPSPKLGKKLGEKSMHEKKFQFHAFSPI